MRIAIQFAEDEEYIVIEPSKEDIEAVRGSFNPSGIPIVNTIKALSAALVQSCKTTAYVDKRSADIAQVKIEEGCMWAVKAATASQ